MHESLPFYKTTRNSTTQFFFFLNRNSHTIYYNNNNILYLNMQTCNVMTPDDISITIIDNNIILRQLLMYITIGKCEQMYVFL